MKPKSTLTWTESFLRQYSKEAEKITSDWQTITAVTELLKFHASQLQDSADARLALLEVKVTNLETDASIQGMRGKR